MILITPATSPSSPLPLLPFLSPSGGLKLNYKVSTFPSPPSYVGLDKSPRLDSKKMTGMTGTQNLYLAVTTFA